MKKLTKCSLCKSSLILTKKAREVKQLSKEMGFVVKRMDYTGDLKDNEYSCSNPKCVFHNEGDIKRFRPQGYKFNNPERKSFNKDRGEFKKPFNRDNKKFNRDSKPFNKERKPFFKKRVYNPVIVSKEDLFK